MGLVTYPVLQDHHREVIRQVLKSPTGLDALEKLCLRKLLECYDRQHGLMSAPSEENKGKALVVTGQIEVWKSLIDVLSFEAK